MNETLIDRLEGPSSYVLPGIGVVQVVPAGGIRWDFPADKYAFERVPDRGRLMAADLRSRYYPGNNPLPPSDVRGSGAFVSCVSCAAVPKHQRCSECPRGRVRLNVRRRTEPTPERKPRLWRRWRKQRELCPE